MTLKRGSDPRGSQRPKQLPRSSVLTVLQPCFYLRLYSCSLWLCSKINEFIWPIRYGIFGVGYFNAEDWRAKLLTLFHFPAGKAGKFEGETGYRPAVGPFLLTLPLNALFSLDQRKRF